MGNDFHKLVVVVGIIVFLAILGLSMAFVVSKTEPPKVSTDLITVTNNKDLVVLFMDTWSTPPYEYWFGSPSSPEWQSWWDEKVNPHIDEVLVPFAFYLRENSIPIVFSPNERTLSRAFRQDLWLCPIINKPDDLDAYLKGMKIDTIYYAGYASNLCVLTRPTGVLSMQKLGYKVVLIKDATLPVPNVEMSYEEALREIKKVGDVITIQEFKDLINK
jgi:nicotinamidase-related amidase